MVGKVNEVAPSSDLAVVEIGYGGVVNLGMLSYLVDGTIAIG